MEWREAILEFHCHNLPGAEFDGKTECRLGIQRGDQVIEDVPADSKEAVFEVPFRALFDEQWTPVDFRGPFVQGKAGERFVYLVWGQRDGEDWTTLRRAKFYLRCIGKERLIEGLETATFGASMRLNMTDAKGKPLTASIREESFRFIS